MKRGANHESLNPAERRRMTPKQRLESLETPEDRPGRRRFGLGGLGLGGDTWARIAGAAILLIVGAVIIGIILYAFGIYGDFIFRRAEEAGR